MNKSDFNHYVQYLRHTKLSPTGFTENGKLVAVIVRKIIDNLHKNRKARKLTLASLVCDQDSGHVDTIRFTKETYNESKSNVYRVLVRCLEEDWIVDSDTKEFLVAHKQVKNSETHRWGNH